MSWTERAADRSPLVQQWRSRNARQIEIMVAAAKRLIMEKGASFTTQELAREAGVALQTFYRYFGSKDQLLLATLEDLHFTMARRYAEGARDLPDPLARLHYYIATTLAGADGWPPVTGGPQSITAEHWRLHQLFPEEMTLAAKPMVDLYARELRDAQEQGLISPSDVQQSAELMVMLVRAVYHHYAFMPQRRPADIADHVWELCLQGIGAPPSRAADENGNVA